MNDRLLNPTYEFLHETILAEQAIARAKLDLNTYALTLSCDFLYNKTEVNNNLEFLIRRITSEGYKTKHSLAMSIVNYLTKKYKFKESRDFVSKSSRIIRNLYEMEMPLSAKTLTYYFSSKYDSAHLSLFRSMLLDKRQSLISKNDLTALIEVEFALGYEYYSRDIWHKSVEIINTFDLSKKSKVALLLLEGKITAWKNYLVQIEKSLEDSRSKSSLPIISLLIYETEKLINTNLPTEKLNELLNLLKSKSNKWARMIDDIKDNGITLNLSNINSFNNIDVEDGCWTLVLLDKAGRKRIYEMSEDEKHQLLQYQKIEKDLLQTIPINATKNFIVNITIWLIIVTIYFLLFGWHQVVCLFVGTCNPGNINIAPQRIEDLLSLPVATLFFIKYYYDSWRYLKTYKKFSWTAVQKSLFNLFSLNPPNKE